MIDLAVEALYISSRDPLKRVLICHVIFRDAEAHEIVKTLYVASMYTKMQLGTIEQSVAPHPTKVIN